MRIKVLISVQSSKKLLGKLGVMQRATWGQLLRSNIDIVFVVGDPSLTEPVPAANQTVLLPCSDDYPPLNKQFQMLKYWYHNRLEEFDFFVKIDGDSYVNINSLLDLLKFLKSPRSTHYYFGEPGEGNSEDIGHLGLNGTYCTGIAFIFSHYSIKSLGPHLDECLDDVVSIWDDAEVGRCMQKHLNLQCTLARNGHPYNLRKMFYNVYFWDEDLRLFDLKKESTGQMKGKFPQKPKQIHFDSIVLHPFKNPKDLRRFHDQVTKYLRPIQYGLYLDKKFVNRLPKQLRKYVKTKPGIEYRDAFYSYFWELHASCVHSPALQYVLTGFWLPECPLSQQISKLIRINGDQIPKYILSMDSPKALKEFKIKKAMLGKFNFDVERLIAVDGSKLTNATKKQIDPETGELMEAGDTGYKLTPGEVGYRESMRKLFNLWYDDRKNDLVMVFDDDFVVHKDFRNKLEILLHNTRCAGHLFTKNEGGILLLGGFEFINGSYPHITKWTGGWHLIDEEFRIRAHNRRIQLLNFPSFQFSPNILSKKQPQTCYNIHDRTFGNTKGLAKLFKQND